MSKELEEKIDEQAREIERLTQERDSQQRTCIRVMEELAALKAQPSGVVLPEPMRRGDEGGSGEYGAAMIRGYNACLREVARLNSSPVSAGELVIDLDASAWAQIKEAASQSAWIPEQYFMNDWVSDVCAFLREPRAVSAGGVDERE